MLRPGLVTRTHARSRERLAIGVSAWPRCGGALSHLAAAAFLLAAVMPAAAAPPLTVPINSCAETVTATGYVGPYSGGTGGAMRQFNGIPYAAPPTGANRWQPPQPYCWSGDFQANIFGPVCPQGPSLQPWAGEDCLRLNIFTQTTGTVANRPVMVFLHGGGLVGGSGSFVGNDPVNLVSKGVIVVTLNYRLGALGFLAHPALDNVTPINTGNYGLLDQIAALVWVRDNIAAFGGNPANITVFGGSAGGLSILALLVSPLAEGLFHKAIIQSSPTHSGITPLAEAENHGTTFGNSADCATGDNATKAACLRALPVNTILAKQGVLGQSTRLLRMDGTVLPDFIGARLMSGNFHDVPIISGSNRDEQRFHLSLDKTYGTGTACNFRSNIVPNNQATFNRAVRYTDALRNRFGSLASKVQPKYPSGQTPLSANTAFTAAGTDHLFACPGFRARNNIVLNGGKVWAYEFNVADTPLQHPPGPVTLRGGVNFPLGSYHGAESPFIFRPWTLAGSCGKVFPGLTTSQRKLANAMVTYWTTFAKTGQPNPGGTVPVWRPYTGKAGKMLSFQGSAPLQIGAASFDTSHKCSSFWNPLQP